MPSRPTCTSARGDQTNTERFRKLFDSVYRYTDGHPTYNLLTDDFMRTAASTDGDKQLVWQIDDVCDKRAFAYTSARKHTDGAPWFEAGDAVSVEGATANSVTLSFPQAEDDVCVYGYRIELKDAEHPLKKKITKEIYSEYYFEPMPERLRAVSAVC